MNQLSEQIRIDASPERVWGALSDITTMRSYMPGISEVQLRSESSSGVGAIRHCVFEDGVELTERVLEWREGEGYTLEIVESKGVPMKSNVVTFQVAASGASSVVTQSMQYEMKGWIFAPLLERMAAGMMRKALRGALGGLKGHVEASGNAQVV